AIVGKLRSNWLRENRRTPDASRKASSRMPSYLRSKIQSGPVNRSWVSVAAIGSSQSGIAAREGTSAIMTERRAAWLGQPKPPARILQTRFPRAGLRANPRTLLYFPSRGASDAVTLAVPAAGNTGSSHCPTGYGCHHRSGHGFQRRGG